jgi:DNA-binding transcriptional regulator YiaG
MSESYILLQIDNGNNAELMDDGYYFEAKNKGYYAEFFSDENEAFRECAKAEYFSSMSVRQQLPEESINQLMINALVGHLKLRKRDVDYLDSNDDSYNIETYIKEILESDLNNVMCDFSDIEELVNQKIIDDYVSGTYDVVPINRVGEIIRIDGIEALINAIDSSHQSSNKKTILDELNALKNYAYNTRLTIEKLGVDQKEFARMFCVADKMTVSKWCNAARKPDDFRIKIMDYILNDNNENIINFLKKHTLLQPSNISEADIEKIRQKKSQHDYSC